MDAIHSGPPFHSVVVLDSERCVAGRVSVEHLFEAVIVDVFPEQALAAATDLASTMEVVVDVNHNRARDIMEEPNLVKVDDNLGSVLGRILRDRLKGVVVVEEAGTLVGYLHRMTVISHWREFTSAR